MTEEPDVAHADEIRGVQGWMALDLHMALGLPVDPTAEHQGFSSWADWWAQRCADVRALAAGPAFGGGSYLTAEHDTLGMIAAKFDGDLFAWERANPWVTDTSMPLPAGLRVAVPTEDASVDRADGDQQPETEARCARCGQPIDLRGTERAPLWVHRFGNQYCYPGSRMSAAPTRL